MIGWAKRFIRMFPYHFMKISKRTFWSTRTTRSALMLQKVLGRLEPPEDAWQPGEGRVLPCHRSQKAWSSFSLAELLTSDNWTFLLFFNPWLNYLVNTILHKFYLVSYLVWPVKLCLKTHFSRKTALDNFEEILMNYRNWTRTCLSLRTCEPQEGWSRMSRPAPHQHSRDLPYTRSPGSPT